MNKDIMNLLALAFKAGINAGIIEAAHKADCLMDKKADTFEDFLELAKPLIQLLETNQ